MGRITISKEFANRGMKIAGIVTENLSFSYFDSKIVKEVALKSKVPEIEVPSAVEIITHTSCKSCYFNK